jgi:hypothetical protein
MIEHMLVSMELESAEEITAQLAAVVDGLLDLDPDTLGDAELADAVVQLHSPAGPVGRGGDGDYRGGGRAARPGRRRVALLWDVGGAPLPPPGRPRPG